MFEQARYIQNSFSLFYPEQRSFSTHEQDIFARLEGRYFPARLVTISGAPGDEEQRLLFQSQHGHSQIVVSAGNVTLNVSYSPDWQTKPADAREYMRERTLLLFGALESFGGGPPLFCGSVTRAQLPSQADDRTLASFVARTFAGQDQPEDFHDVILRTTVVIDDRFFSNVTVQNYRVWSVSLPTAAVYRVSRFSAADRGVEVISDFNSRYAFNEDRPFEVTRENALEMLDRNFAILEQTIDKARTAAND